MLFKCHKSIGNSNGFFSFLSCREKAHDNKEFGREVSKLRCESRAVKEKPGVNK